VVVAASDVALPHCRWWSCAVVVGGRRRPWLLGMVVTWGGGARCCGWGSLLIPVSKI